MVANVVITASTDPMRLEGLLWSSTIVDGQQGDETGRHKVFAETSEE
jgi:hypothetical protein